MIPFIQLPEAGGDDRIQVGRREYKADKVNSGVHQRDCGDDFIDVNICHGLSRWLRGEESACQRRRCRCNLRNWEDPLEKETATPSSIPA